MTLIRSLSSSKACALVSEVQTYDIYTTERRSCCANWVRDSYTYCTARRPVSKSNTAGETQHLLVNKVKKYMKMVAGRQSKDKKKQDDQRKRTLKQEERGKNAKQTKQ